jgi:hypothetical protein
LSARRKISGFIVLKFPKTDPRDFLCDFHKVLSGASLDIPVKLTPDPIVIVTRDNQHVVSPNGTGMKIFLSNPFRIAN